MGKIVEQHKISAMKEVVASLADIAKGWTPSESNESGIEEIDWSRSSSLDIQDATYRRNALIGRLAKRVCIKCESFDEHVSNFISSFAIFETDGGWGG